MVLAVVEAAFRFPGQEIIVIPLVMRLRRRLGTFEKERSGGIEWKNHHAVFHWSDFHVPVAGVGQRVEIAVIDEAFQVDLEWAARARKSVANEGGVLALNHPNTFLEQSVGEGVSPNWS